MVVYKKKKKRERHLSLVKKNLFSLWGDRTCGQGTIVSVTFFQALERKKKSKWLGTSESEVTHILSMLSFREYYTSARRIPSFGPILWSLLIVNIQISRGVHSCPVIWPSRKSPTWHFKCSHIKVLSVPKSSFLQISCCLSLNKRWHEVDLLRLQRWHCSLMWERPEQQTQAGERKQVHEPAHVLSVCATDSCTMKYLSPAAAEHRFLLRMFQVWCLDPFLL